MMKRRIAGFLMLLLLAGCTAPETTETRTPTATAAAEPTAVTTVQTEPHGSDDPSEVLGVWRNVGQYEEGREFVETMTLDEAGRCYVQLDYQGEPYQLLIGTFSVSGDWLYTTLDNNGEQVERDFRFTRDGRELILEAENKTVTYIKVD